MTDDKESGMRVWFDAIRDHELRVVMESAGGRRTVDFQCGGVNLSCRAGILAACGLLPAMSEGCELHLEEPLAASGLERLYAIRDLYAQWHPGLRKVEIRVPDVIAPIPSRPGSGAALFFSGGVDSFYSLLKHQHEITDLVFVHGFDIAAHDRQLGERVAQGMAAVAAGFGKRLILIRTNVRESLASCGPWGQVTHGAAMAAVASMLPDEIGKVYFAASCYHGYQQIWGSHPQLDPLWGRADLEIVHDGDELKRYEKIALIASNPIVREHLRVCWKNPDGAYNCCRCEKCLRTMIDLRACGELQNCAAFPKPIDPACVRRMKESYAGVIDGQLELLADDDDNRELRRALRLARIRNRWRRGFNRLLGRSRGSY